MLRLIQRASELLARYTTVAVALVVVPAFVWPGLFGWVRADAQALVLGLIMLAMGMTLTAEDFRALARRPVDIAIGAVAQYTIMPLLAFGLVRLFELPEGIAAGLILVGCCPGGVSSNIMSLLCKGDVAFSVGMTTVSTLLAPLVTPLLVLWLARQNIEVDAFGLFRSILLVTLLPVGLGVSCNLILGKTRGYAEMLKLMPGLAVLGLMCIVGGVISAQGAVFFDNGAMIFLTVFLHNSGGYLLGYLSAVLSGMGIAKRRTLSIEVGMQNAGLATVLATRHFPLLPEAAMASAVCCVWHSLSGTILAGLFLRFGRKLPSADSEHR